MQAHYNPNRRGPLTPPGSPNPHAAPIAFAPAMPIPPVISVPDTIARLRTYPDPTHQDYWREEQHVNIRKAIQMYEQGELDGWRRVFIVGGKVVTREEAFKGLGWCWCEGGTIFR